MKRSRSAGKVLALIPARSGSQRVKNKNLRLLGGKPLIAWTIEAALKAKLVDRVVVSTDSPAIAKVAKKYGAEVPFLRPKAISGTNSTELEFHIHALESLKLEGDFEPELIVNLYPTSPFRKAKTIDEAIRAIRKKPKASSLRSIRRCSEHPFKMWVMSGDQIVPFVNKKAGTQTLSYQLLPAIYIQNASIYITKPETLRKSQSTTGKYVIPFEMDEYESVDINDPLDFFLAEQLLKKGSL